MSADELAKEIVGGVIFWMAEDNGQLLGVMGIQDKEDVAFGSTCLYRDDVYRGKASEQSCFVA